MDILFQKTLQSFNHYKSLPNLEIELRLGKKNGNFFDTNIGEEKFNKIKTALDNFKEWEEVTDTEISSYFLGEKRMDFNEKTEETKTIIKDKFFKFDHVLENQPLDIRLSFAKETPCDDIDSEADFMRHKVRKSYIRKNLSIDLTIVSGDSEDMDDECENKYEVELEIIDPSKINSEKTLYNIIYKIYCILKTL